MAQQRSVISARQDFPILQTQMNGKPLAFLDSGASAQKPSAVINVMNDIYERGYSNIHRGLYAISQDLTARFEEARKTIAAFIGASNENEIVFTRNATEAINLVAQSWGRTFLSEGDEVIITAMEHHANIVPWQILRDQIGIVIKIIPVNDDGILDLDAYQNMLSPRTKFVGAVHISNATGVINPINEIIRLAKDFNPEIKVLIDGSQSVVHTPVHMLSTGADFFCFTGHKLYGPSGIGVLYGRHEVLQSMPPYQGGGDMIERVTFEKTTYKDAPFRFEAGTPAIAEVIGLAAAIDYVQDFGMEAIAAHEHDIYTYAMDALSDVDGMRYIGNVKHKAGIISFVMDDVHISDIGMILDQCGVAVRAGHHCCMPLMQRFGLDGTVRASLGMYSNKDDIDALVGGLKKVRELFA